MRSRLSVWLPTALALLALVIALGAPAQARRLINGKLIKAGTVASKQLRDGGVAGRDVAAGTLTGEHVADGSLTGSDVADDSLTAADLKPGAVGPDELADDGIAAKNLQPNALQGRGFDAAGFVELSFGTVANGRCADVTATLPEGEVVDGTLLDDTVVVTPGTFLAAGYTWAALTPSDRAITVRVCNLTGASGDPDGAGTGRQWRYVAVDVD
jgi:hypothetical protein